MKNNKGFTLVELLAVIAILAILVVIALPNVLDMFNSAKQNSFATEVQTIMKTAQQEYVLSSGSKTKFGSSASCTNKLKLSGETMEYYVEFVEGKIVGLMVKSTTNTAFTYKNISTASPKPEITIQSIKYNNPGTNWPTNNPEIQTCS